MEVEQRYVIKFLVEEGMKGVEIIDKLDKYYGWDALRRRQVYYLIKEVKSGRKDLSDVWPPGRVSDMGLNDCIGKVLREDPRLSTTKIAKALNVSSTTARKHLTKSLGMKRYHMRWVPHTLTATQSAKSREMAGSMLQTWKAVPPPTSTSCGLAMSRGCSMSSIMKQCGQHH
jgi:hypothetical protein